MGATADNVVVRAQDFIHENLAADIRVSDLSAYCGVSVSTLERVFKRDFGAPPKTYIRAARLHEARRRLRDAELRDLAISNIATSCGFRHLGRFAAQYRNMFGLLPSEERRAGPVPIAHRRVDSEPSEERRAGSEL